jgi:hypothetical protein
MLKAINQSAVNATNVDPENICYFCDTDDYCARCDATDYCVLTDT